MTYSLNKNKFLTDSEYEVLKKELDINRATDARNVTMIELALHTGARASEILNIDVEDLNPEEASVLIKGIKKSNDREIPLPPRLFERVKSLTTQGKIFPISYQRLNQVWDMYRPCKKKFHSLRHRFGLKLYEKRRDIRLVQTALGHKSITNTMIYVDYHFSVKELRRLL
jgi:integrase